MVDKKTIHYYFHFKVFLKYLLLFYDIIEIFFENLKKKNISIKINQRDF